MAVIGSLAVALGLVFPVQAHHSFAANYLLDQIIELQGTVKKFSWRNPHCTLTIEVESDNGETELWLLEMNNTIFATRAGWTRETFQPGDVLFLTGNPTRNGSNRLSAVTIDRPADGFSYKRRAIGTDAGEGAGSRNL